MKVEKIKVVLKKNTNIAKATILTLRGFAYCSEKIFLNPSIEEVKYFVCTDIGKDNNKEYTISEIQKFDSMDIEEDNKFDIKEIKLR